MMSTERRASAIGMPAGSPRAPQPPSSSIPRDLQRPSGNQDSAPPQPGSPDRKRPRYEPSLSRDEEEMDELEETTDNDHMKRQRGGSDEPIKIERKGSGPESASRSSSAQEHHAHWAGRSASANLDSRYPQQHPPPPPHRMGEESGKRFEHYDRPYPLSRYESGGPSMREDGRHAGGMVGERYGGEPDRDPRERLGLSEAKMEYNSPSMRMPPPNAGDPSLPSFRNRPSSPPPRLPSFASLEPEAPLSHRSRDDAALGAGGPYSSSPHRRGMPPSAHHYPSYSPYPQPHPSSRTPLMHHHPSPTPSTSYGNPPMIHPALAGLPGAGGGPGGKQQPSFVSKLYSMLEDPSISDLISWGSSGTVFSVANPAEFSRLVLPNWFKHSNWQSFVRQLNMYGFHKVNHSYQGNPTDEVQVWEFRHPSFRRGEISLLNDIKRKSSRQKRGGSPRGSVGGDGLRADRSGGSSTPSPEVPLATIPGHHEGMMRMGGPMGPRRGEFGYGDDRMDHGYPGERRPDPRGFSDEQRYGGPREDYYMRSKMESSGGPPPPPPGIPTSSGPPGPAGMAPPYPTSDAAAPRRAPPGATDPIERTEAIARFEDLSERTDAIIRHASFLESQIRILSNQLADSRAFTSQVVREEMVTMLSRLERALSAPPQPGVDPVARMVEVIRGQLDYYSHRPNDRKQPPPAHSQQQQSQPPPPQQQQQQQQQQGGPNAGGTKRPSI